MTQPRPLRWVSDATDRRVNIIRAIFLQALEQQSRNMINYYDFLLVAKKLNFRFEESTHLMELRKYFFNNKNQLNNKKLVNILCIEEETLNEMVGDNHPIIRFKVGNEQIESIKEVTNEDEQLADQEQTVMPYAKVAEQGGQEDSQQYRQKLTIILSIKVAEMIKKIKMLVEGVTVVYQNEEHVTNLASIAATLSQNQLPYELFRKIVVNLLKKMESEFFKEKLTISEDDIKAFYAVLDKGQGITREQLQNLKDDVHVAKRITKFYEARINKKMVKNTLFKLGKNSNSIQIFQVKNASVLQFKSIEDTLLERQKSRERINKGKIPHFGPIKGNHAKNSPPRSIFPQSSSKTTNRNNHSSLSTYKRGEGDNLQKQRQKIERIIRSSKEQKKRNGNDTIANKLRKLFIHKVILPRQRLLEEQKMKYLGSKSQSSQMIVKIM